MTTPILDLLRHELEALDKKRAAVEAAIEALSAEYDEERASPRERALTLNFDRTGPRSRPSGPTEVFLEIVTQYPGIPRNEAIKMAVPRVSSSSENKRGAIRESLRAMIRRERLIERDGGLYLP